MWAEILFYNFFLVPIRKIISAQEIYSDSLFNSCITKMSFIKVPYTYINTHKSLILMPQFSYSSWIDYNFYNFPNLHNVIKIYFIIEAPLRFLVKCIRQLKLNKYYYFWKRNFSKNPNACLSVHDFSTTHSHKHDITLEPLCLYPTAWTTVPTS